MDEAELLGQPWHAVLPPPALERFRRLVGPADGPATVVVGGWHKLVVLEGRRALLFPRRAEVLPGFERELAVYGAEVAVPFAPRLLARWDDTEIHPLPFAAVTRLPGARPDDAAGSFASLGETIARWHAVAPPPALVDALPPAHHAHEHQRWLRRALDPATTGAAVAEAADRLGATSDEGTRWTELLARAASLTPVLVHGDVHEDQLLCLDGRISGVVDWETARVDHPFWDFDLGEWGTGLWRVHGHELDRLSSVAWQAYATARGLDPDPEPLLVAFRLRQALRERAAGAKSP